VKALLAAAVLAASSLTPPPLAPLLPEPPVEQELPGYARWWVWALAGTASAQTVGALLLLAYGVIPALAQRPIPVGTPR
jgi:hypothetical protein